jgi:chemotaxis protein methyltransferase WspC
MKEIERALRERLGLNPASIGSGVIERSIRLRMKRHGIEKAQDYLLFLQGSKTEWSELTESVVVAETWFFRDVEPFQAFVRLVVEEWIPSHPQDRLRLLSLPCSSGEEPYSLAMALLDAGFVPDRVELDAVDVSARALNRARKGIYGKNSFRGSRLEFRNKYFHPTAAGFALDSSVTKMVRFSEGNLLAEDFQPPNNRYDFIFCRNLLIYFDASTQRKALTRIGHLLAADGTLFVGAAEQPVVLEQGFVSAHLPMAFACRKASGELQRPALAAPSTEAPVVANLAKSNGHSALVDALTAPATGLPELDKAKLLADQGHLKEAASICEAHLRNGQPSAQAYYLLGLVRDATGDPTAPDYYRKALYLEPNHYHSLLQLAFWSEKNGETALARRLKNRAQRVKADA